MMPGFAAPFFDPTRRYGSQHNPEGWRYQPGEFMQTPVGQSYGRDLGNFESMWMRETAGAGVDPFSNRGKYLAGMNGRLMTGYKAALATNPMLNPDDYLRGQRPLLEREFSTAGATGQGLNYGQFAPPARTQARGF